MSDHRPPAGWYPAQHANNEMRYWDGARWLEPGQQATIPLSQHEQAQNTNAFPNPAGRARTQPLQNPTVAARGFPSQLPQSAAGQSIRGNQMVRKPLSRAKKGWIIAGSAVAGLIVFGSIGSAMGNRGTTPQTPPSAETAATVIETTEAEPAETQPPAAPEPVMVEVPPVVGMTATEAWLALAGAGLVTQEISTFEDPLAVVESSTPAAGEQVEEGTTVTLAVAVAPQFTLAQQNAIRQAQSYLDYSGFSREGLIGQLEYEGYSTEEATLGADNSGADWNAEAAESAQSYLEYTSFSRQGLYDQLAYEGFTPEQIEFGLAQVGY